MYKKHFALIGYPLKHSMSPFIHKRLFELSKISADYDLFNISPFDLKSAFSTLKNLDGFNVTLPHKKEIIYYINELSNKAKLCGSVNTVKNVYKCDDRCSVGYTTDPRGFLKALEEADITLKGRIVILGCGGAARAIAYETTCAGCETIIAVRPQSLNNAAALTGNIYTNVISPNIQTCLIDKLTGPIDLLVNATPVGMYPNINASPISPETLSNCKAVFDAIYNPVETVLLKTAKSMGIKTVNGMNMLVWQAVYTHKIWNDSSFSVDEINQLCEDTTIELKKLFNY